jgi:transcriptional regulator with XRE-family HTH domain
MRTSETAAPTGTPPLRAVREAHGLGLREVARRAAIDPSQLSRVERGQAQLSVEALARLARVLGLQELTRLLEPYVSRGHS